MPPPALARVVIVAALILTAAPPLAAAGQTTTPAAPSPAPSSSEGWRITVYPVLGWVPSGVDVDINLPPVGGGEGGDAGFSGEIVDSRFDGAFLGGFSATNEIWRVDAGPMSSSPHPRASIGGRSGTSA